MKAKCAVLLLGMLLLGATNAGAAPITYAVSEFLEYTSPAGSAVGIGGSITTDGTLGPISAANIIDWNLIATATGEGSVLEGFFDETGPLSGGDSTITNAVNITATANALTLGLPVGAIVPAGDLRFGNFDLSGGGLFLTSSPFAAGPMNAFGVMIVL